ncbi:MAG: glycosyltransferase family 9 protein [Rhodospirillaceae bacterium]|mgnify:CR=1 FL=1|jgi:ADP-heptose:LPS heptosyltransferase|nr:glycosyltransferase family 9 protein [Rhodospirillaceae bacterium]MBT5373665.1 glycosyltransferase family 9 protein [Rhodospirillaceae bacterium]MBT5751783.1 glycosyltransferase family 9 protein [Rhodospirillaceae bacterium]
MKTDRPPCQSILVYVGLDLVGDGLMKLPFLRALRRAYPTASITWLAGKGKTVYASKLAPLVTGLLDEVIEDADIGSRWRQLFARPLKGRSFDLIIDTQRRVLTTLILRRIAHKVFVSGAANYLFSDRQPFIKREKKPAAMIRQMLDLVEAASGASADSSGALDLAMDARDAALADLPEPGKGAGYIALAPGAGGEHKRWPLENFITLAKLMAEKGHIPVFFLGPDEADWRPALGAALPQALFPLQDNKVYGIAPDFTIAVAERCHAGVAGDCGIGHMLAAADIPLISLFGPTPPEKFSPCTRRLTILKAQDYEAGRGGEEMAMIPVEAVEKALETALSEA